MLADLDTLETLPPREFRAGYAEVVKYGALGDAAFFGWLDANSARVFAREADALAYAIERSCQMKAEIVARDELEAGDRALLNLGHTFGHAVEAWAGYSGDVLHGEGVALGMVLAAQFSEARGLCDGSVAQRLDRHLKALGFATDFKDLHRQLGRMADLGSLMTFMEQDKKVKGGEMTLILMRGLGEAFVAHGVPRDAIAHVPRSAACEVAAVAAQVMSAKALDFGFGSIADIAVFLIDASEICCFRFCMRKSLGAACH